MPIRDARLVFVKNEPIKKLNMKQKNFILIKKKAKIARLWLPEHNR